MPLAVTGISDAVSLSAGDGHTCAVLAGGTVACWGNGAHGQLGNGTAVHSSMPASVWGLSGAVSVSAGARHTCAVMSGGAIACWGQGTGGQLGNGALEHSSLPVAVSASPAPLCHRASDCGFPLVCVDTTHGDALRGDLECSRGRGRREEGGGRGEGSSRWRRVQGAWRRAQGAGRRELTKLTVEIFHVCSTKQFHSEAALFQPLVTSVAYSSLSQLPLWRSPQASRIPVLQTPDVCACRGLCHASCRRMPQGRS